MENITEVLNHFDHLFAFPPLVGEPTTLRSGKIERRIILSFKDNSSMEIFESTFKNKYKYSYHWMRADKTLIIRWDNTPHLHKVSTMPDHKHVGTEQNVQESEPMNLHKVLAYIAKTVGFLVLILVFIWLFL